MNCSQCGLQTAPDQKFCRSCGAELQKTTTRLAAPASDLEATSALSLKGEGRRGNGLTLWGLIIMFIGVAIGVIGKMLMHDEIITVIGVLVSLVGMFLTAYPYLSPSPRQKRVSIPSSQPEVLIEPTPARYLPLETSVEYLPSITDRTTELLKNPAATKPGRTEYDESS